LSTTVCGHNQSVNEDADGSHDYLRIGGHLYREHIGGSIRMLHLSVKYICWTHVNRMPPREEPQYRNLGDPTEEFPTDLTYCLIHSGVTGVETRYRTDFIDNPSLSVHFDTTSSTFVASAIIMLCRPYIITIRPGHTVAIVTTVITSEYLDAVDTGDLAPDIHLQLHVSRIFDLKVVEDRDQFVRIYFDLLMHLINRGMIGDSDKTVQAVTST
ncbi:hypothetical protein BDD12DRAFT_938508, partial [Trichophaea hybrida]